MRGAIEEREEEIRGSARKEMESGGKNLRMMSSADFQEHCIASCSSV